MHFSAFRVLVFSSTISVENIFARGGGNKTCRCSLNYIGWLHFSRCWTAAFFHNEISFYQLKTNRKTFLCKKWIAKYKISKFMGPKPSLPTPFRRSRLDQIRKPFLWHIRFGHEHQLLQGFECNFYIIWGFKQTKNPLNRDMFWKTFWYKSCLRKLILDASLLKNLVLKAVEAGVSWPISSIDLHLLASKRSIFVHISKTFCRYYLKYKLVLDVGINTKVVTNKNHK